MSYLEDFEKTLAEKCHHQSLSRRSARHLSVGWISGTEKWKKADVSTRRTEPIQNTVGFRILCRSCAAIRARNRVCARSWTGNRDGAFRAGDGRVREAEIPNAYNLRRRKEKDRDRQAVFRGLGCALRLCNKVRVTVYVGKWFWAVGRETRWIGGI